MIIVIVLLSAILITCFFAAFDVAHKYDEVDDELVKMLMCQDAQEICNHDCENCAWGKGEKKE